MSCASRKLRGGVSDGLADEYTHMNATPMQHTHFVPSFTHSLSIHEPFSSGFFLVSSVCLFVYSILYKWVWNE